MAGAIFTLPALFILGLDKTIGFDLFKIFMVSFLGGALGVLFLIPFRKYFVKEMHGHFPFPEATATTQVLVAGEKGGAQAKILVKSMLIGGVFDFMVHSVGRLQRGLHHPHLRRRAGPSPTRPRSSSRWTSSRPFWGSATSSA